MNSTYMKWTVLNDINQVCTLIDLCRTSDETEVTSNWQTEKILISEYQPEVMMSQYTGHVHMLISKLLPEVEGDGYHPTLLLHSLISLLVGYARNIDNFNVTIIGLIDTKVTDAGDVEEWMVKHIDDEDPLNKHLALSCNSVNKIYNLPGEIVAITDPKQIKLTIVNIGTKLLGFMEELVQVLIKLNEIGIPIGEHPDIGSGMDIPDDLLEQLNSMSPEDLAKFNVPDLPGGSSETTKEAYKRIPETLELIKKMGIQKAGELISDRNKQ